MTDPSDLYGLPLERFIAERAALAKALRSDGERDGAAEVAKLRKPSVAAWAVNQLVRTQRRAIADLFEAGDQLQRAQSDLLGGRGDAAVLRETAGRERAAVEELTATARGLLTTQGHELSPAALERVGETLHAAALDSDARAAVDEGCLERELRHVGLGDAGASPAGALPANTKRPAKSKQSSARPRDATRKRLDAARKEAEQARRAAERAARGLRLAQERRDRAAAALADADSALAAAREEADDADEAHRRAEQALAERRD